MTRRTFLLAIAAAIAVTLGAGWITVSSMEGFTLSLADLKQFATKKSRTSRATAQANDPLAKQSLTTQEAIRTVTKAVGLLLNGALAALNEKPANFASARSFLMQADALANKSAYDIFKIYEVWSYFHFHEKDTGALLDTYQALLSKPELKKFLSPAETASKLKAAAQTAYSAGDYARAIEFGEELRTDHSEDPQIMMLLTQSYYVTKSYPNCRDLAAHQLALTLNAGQRPKELTLQLLQSCASLMGNTADAERALEALCRYFPKPEYWRRYVVLHSRRASEPVAYQWMQFSLAAVGRLDKAEDYVWFAQLSMDFERPANATRVLMREDAIRLFDSDLQTRGRTQRLLLRAQDAVQVSLGSIPALTVNAAADPTGQKDYELGVIRFDHEQYGQATASLTEALRKNKFADTGLARLLLGIAQLRSGHMEPARDTFESEAIPVELKSVAYAWNLFSHHDES